MNSSLSEALAAKRLLIGAHRGASAYFPENTLAAFKAAISHRADFLELDVRLSLDSIPVVIHDDTIDRTTTGTGNVVDLSAETLGHYGVPALDDVLAIGGGKVFFNIELKETPKPQLLVSQVLTAIERHNAISRVLISSTEIQLLSFTKDKQAAILTGLIVESAQADIIEKALALRVDSLNPYFRLIDRNFIAKAHNTGLYVIPWTVDRPLYLRYLSRIKVDGIITNRPDSAIQALHY